MIISDRNLYIAAHVTKEVKLKLVKEAYKKGMSVSHMIHTILKKELVGAHENAHHQ
jgi:signal recognition particle GTPase|tara:strand:+ start:1833 stop:2000 length:168 start_codon:yes stop_codon:yes gene_type:complete